MLGYEVFKHLACLIDRAPQLDHFTSEPAVHHRDASRLLAAVSHLVSSLVQDACDEQLPEPVRTALWQG